MCGRFTLWTPAGRLAERFDLSSMPDLKPRYNVAPTQSVAAVRVAAEGGREATLLRWGLVPSWADDPSVGARMINARSETVAEKPSFRTALARRRCLVLADGFYEWQPIGKRKQPWLFRLRDGSPFAFAGLWERWPGRGGEPLESCTVLTTSANDLVKPVHDRMPVILRPESEATWLDVGIKPASVLGLLVPFAASDMTASPVDPRVGNARIDDPSCVEIVTLA
jgi:putative SOS response-associated peptidase YedK